MSESAPRTPSHLEPQQYFESIDADTERLLSVATANLDAAVPCCPGWSVADVVSHLAAVYEHKVRVMADNAWPDPWPPAGVPEQAPLDRLGDAKAALFAEFANHQITDPTTTFSADDPTIGFWARRMALEVAVHRYDAELAVGEVTGISDQLALDGIDEVLTVMLAGPWWADRVSTRHPVEANVAVQSGGRRWVCALEAKSVAISDDAMSPIAAAVTGEPTAVFLWLWGRVGDDHITVEGDPRVAAEFRARLVECTG
jgi:uncharacterized protein (TIGR03083 family)